MNPDDERCAGCYMPRADHDPAIPFISSGIWTFPDEFDNTDCVG